MIDYKKLLLKYIWLIKEYEGIDYISRADNFHDVLFIEEEIEELKELSKLADEL